MLKKVTAALHDGLDSIDKRVEAVSVKLSTSDSLKVSEAIKLRIREKIAKLSEEQKQTRDYANLISIHEQVEKNHDAIYNQPKTTVSVSQAEEDTAKLVKAQEGLETAFNAAYASLTKDPAVKEEGVALQAEAALRDVEATRVKAIADANATAEEAVAATQPKPKLKC